MDFVPEVSYFEGKMAVIDPDTKAMLDKMSLRLSPNVTVQSSSDYGRQRYDRR